MFLLWNSKFPAKNSRSRSRTTADLTPWISWNQQLCATHSEDFGGKLTKYFTIKIQYSYQLSYPKWTLTTNKEQTKTSEITARKSESIKFAWLSCIWPRVLPFPFVLTLLTILLFRELLFLTFRIQKVPKMYLEFTFYMLKNSIWKWNGYDKQA